MLLRWALNCMAFPLITFYIFSIDNDYEEKTLDQVKDFTGLLIIVELDNMIKFDDVVPNFDYLEQLQVVGPNEDNDHSDTKLRKFFREAVEFQV